MSVRKKENSGHRAGPLKQQNKTHKHGRHRSNRTLDNINKGKQNLKTITKRANRELLKSERRNQVSQRRTNKRDEILSKKRSLGVQGTPPHLVAIVSLSSTTDPFALLELVKHCDSDSIVSTPTATEHYHISFPRYKQRLEFFIPPVGDLYSIMDTAKVADTMILLHSVNEQYDEDEENESDSFKDLLQTVILAHGMPSIVHVLQGIESVPTKKKQEVKKQLLKTLQTRFPDSKLNCLEKEQDALLLVHQIISQKRRSITVRDRRAHMLAETYSFEASENDKTTGSLKVSGYIRGQPLSVNNLVHIPGHGTFQLLQIDGPPDPYPLRLKQIDDGEDDTCMLDVENIKVLEVCDVHEQESLQCENVPDPMEGEQTWPTQEEIEQAEAEQLLKTVKKVPKGTSEYQAAWIVEDENDDLSDVSENEDEPYATDEMKMDSSSIISECSDNEVTDDESEMLFSDEKNPEKYDEHVNFYEDKEMFDKFKEERMNELFPDEVDTPMDKPAKTRFQKYRGLKSFNSTPWDPKENLPLDYARIFQFDNFNRTRNRILKEARDGVLPGWYVTLHLSDVPKSVYDNLSNGVTSCPLVVYGLLPHEQKMSVTNVVLKRHPTCLEPIKSKEKLIFHIGFRRFAVNPIFSAHTSGNKHKYERFMRTDTAVVATFYAPITFPPAPVVVFKANMDGTQQLVATGSILNNDPDRVVVKRVVLSGHPFKINKRSVVVRYMFFSRDDILWFKPVELSTKYGRRGHIQEPLGTHGHMKCKFDAQLKSQDTVLMNLYKRVFPKFTIDCIIPRPPELFHII